MTFAYDPIPWLDSTLQFHTWYWCVQALDEAEYDYPVSGDNIARYQKAMAS